MVSQRVEEILETYEHRGQHIVDVLQDIQQEAGYIPAEVVKAVSNGLNVPLIEVYRVAKFYKAFSLAPRGQHIITTCMGTACHVRGAPRMLDEVRGQLGIEPGETTEDNMFTLECVNCLGACALGPIVVLDGDYHGHMTPNKLRKLVQSVRSGEKEVVADA